MNKPQAELLAPAGSLATLKAVAVAGADAVYAGGVRFGARAYAGNLTEEELLYAIDYLHIHGKRLYLTVNTLLKENELTRELYDYIRPLYEQGLDGVIVQDIGVLKFLREHFPGMELHASTQMTITGVPGARLMKKLGCSRIVTARELSLEEIQRIHDTVDIEIESFVHGALCYCYSGQCLLSSILGGRSGNRGRCAQPCRLPYQVKGAGEAYFLSPKDLCAIELLPQILESGVYSLKIEGRMKQTEYAAGVTGIYREYLDRYLSDPGEPYAVSEKDRRRLLELGNRSGFTSGYYRKHNGPDMMAMKQPAHTKAGQELQEEMRTRFADREIQEKINGSLSLSKGNPACLVLQYEDETVAVEGDTVLKAQNRPLVKADVLERMKKTGGTEFVFGKLDIDMEDDVFLPVGALNQLRRDGICALEEKLLAKYRRRGTVLTTESWKNKGNEQLTLDAETQPYLAVSVQTAEQCQCVLSYPYIDRIYIDSGAFERRTELAQLSAMARTVHQAGKKLFYGMPMILRGDTARWYEENRTEFLNTGIDGIVAGNYEALEMFGGVKNHLTESRLCRENDLGEAESRPFTILADSSLYAWNSQAKAALSEAGADEVTLAVEENEGELRSRDFSGGELILYGHLPLMVSAQCLVKNAAGILTEKQGGGKKTAGCSGKAGFTILTDRYGKHFPVKNQCKYCYNILYNTSPLSLLHQYGAVRKLAASGYRISFTRETEEGLRQVLAWYEQGFLHGKPIDRNQYLSDYTNGHFKRGAE